ncbi:MAG TPA: hypothetical protein DER04_03460 [Holosporales bacterium]|nr:hypothetical protein [Holosporales bacterium]HCE95806.1 hypothetical protein [Holosporales bacterium]
MQCESGESVILWFQWKQLLNIKAFLDNNTYQKGIVVTQEEIESIKLTGDSFHPEWNYTIAP